MKSSFLSLRLFRKSNFYPLLVTSQELLAIYQDSSYIRAIGDTLQKKSNLRLKGIAGSFDTLLLASVT
ncbi:MAG: hypothetical protein AAF616_16580, partial [Bacteroidota bacterium]